MQEVWKTVSGFETYAVSTFGNVRNNISNIVLNPYTHNKGYLIVDLYISGKVSHRRVHRLVAEAFIPNPENKPQINHKDFDKTNNRVWNLEWCTDAENKAYSREHTYS